MTYKRHFEVRWQSMFQAETASTMRRRRSIDTATGFEVILGSVSLPVQAEPIPTSGDKRLRASRAGAPIWDQ